jgi:outer membrane protein assembly factor BamB
MIRRTHQASSILALMVLLMATGTTAQNWPQFRGESARGIANDQDLPTNWDVESGENIRWAADIPGMGHSSPIIWMDRIFLTTAVADKPPELVLGDDGGIDLVTDVTQHSWRLYCLDKSSGEILWFKEAFEGKPSAKRHVKASQTNSTPVTDGRFIAAIFGAEGLVVFDMDGTELWRKDLGVLDPGLFGDASSQWGYSSSPVILDDRLIVQVDRHTDSFVAAYDLPTGDQVWKVERDEKPIWATPTLHITPERSQVVVAGGDFDRGLDPESGRELWRFARDYEVKTTTPLVEDNLIVLSGGYRGKPLFAIRAGATGDVSLAEGQTSNDGVAWVSEPGGPYTSTPIIIDDVIYFVRNTGILTALDLHTGELVFRHRLGGNFSASPVASDGKIYFASEEGVVSVVAAEREAKVLGSNDMGEPCMASPIISAKTLFVRTNSRLYAISNSNQS